MKNCLLLLLAMLCFTCKDPKISKTKNDQPLDQLIELMTGTFSSENQSKADSAFYSINLVMHPIWENNTDARWLYVEQAVSSALDRPYRQRVYKVTQNAVGLFESAVYELPDSKAYIHAWNNPELFEKITPDSLLTREGCSVFLKKDKNGCFSGATKPKACKSTLRGASYATSIVEVCEGKIVSWDQGWNDKEEQVWGAVKSGYIFEKK